MRKNILQILTILCAACPVAGLAQAPKDAVVISNEDIKAVLKYAADTKRTIPDNSIRVIDMGKYQLAVAVIHRHDGGLFQPADQRRRRHRHSRRRAPWLYNHSRSRDVPERAARPEKGSPAWLRQSRAREKVAGHAKRIPLLCEEGNFTSLCIGDYAVVPSPRSLPNNTFLRARNSPHRRGPARSAYIVSRAC